MNRQRLVPFLVAGMMGLLVVFWLRMYLGEQRRTLDKKRQEIEALLKNQVEVVVARHNLPAGTAITKDKLGRQVVPQKFVQPYATSNEEDLVGLVALAPISEGEQVLRTKLQKPGEKSESRAASLSQLTPEGKRAVTIPLDAQGAVATFLQPGDTVDILWSSPGRGGEEGRSETGTVTLFQSIPVLAVGGTLLGQQGAEAGSENASSITLALAPQEASVLLFAREQGRLYLTLRAAADQSRTQLVAPVNMSMFMESYLGRSAKKAEPAPQHTVEVFKGLQRTVVAVNE